MIAISVDDVCVRYGPNLALDRCRFEVDEGSICALLGHNGAGKSTLMSVLCTMRTPDSGAVSVFGADVSRHAVAVRANLGVVFQEQSLDRELTVRRNLKLHARMYGLARRTSGRRIEELLAVFGLSERADEPVESLSGGLARRVELARAVLHEPRLLALDEPTVGLDPESRRLLWRDLHALRDRTGITVLYSTHYMDEAENADSVVILRDGRVLSEGTPAQLKQRLGRSGLRLRTADDDLAVAGLSAAGFGPIRLDGELFVPAIDPATAIAGVVQACPADVLSLSVQTPSMDDVFLSGLPSGVAS